MRFDREYAVISCFPARGGYECKLLGLESLRVYLGRCDECPEVGARIPKERVYIFTRRRAELDEGEREILLRILEEYVRENEDHFLMILNYSGMFTKTRHTLDLLPGIGRARRNKILELRPFGSLEEASKKLNFDFVKAFAKRLMLEVLEETDERVFAPRSAFRPREGVREDVVKKIRGQAGEGARPTLRRGP